MVNGHWVGNRAIRVAIWCVLCCVHGWLNGAFTWLFASKYRTTEPRYLWYCGTKKYRELHGTGTVKKMVPWYRGSTVVPPNTISTSVLWSVSWHLSSFIPEMTYYMWNWTLSSTHSLTLAPPVRPVMLTSTHWASVWCDQQQAHPCGVARW